MKPIRAMLFDLDGTLLDSAPDLVASLNWVREAEGLSPLPVAEMSRYASKGAVGLLNAGMPNTSPEEFESWRQRFLEHYAGNSFRESRLYEGVPELLERLVSAGVPWGVVTNKIESLTFPIIEAAALQESVSCVVCGDTCEQSKPHPAPVNWACSLLNVDPERALFVGDDIRDVQAGRAAGTQTAAAFYGYGSHELDSEQPPANFRINHPSELLALVELASGE